MKRADVLALLTKHKPILKKEFGVKRIALFGSFAKDRANETSDIDILVELEKKNIFRNFFALKNYLERLFCRKVDLGTFDAVKKSIKKEILNESINV